MQLPLTIALLVYDGIQILDVTGPAAVFAAANDAVGAQHYKVHILSIAGGNVQSNCAVALATQPLHSLDPRSVDTLLIAGGTYEPICAFGADPALQKWIMPASACCRRIGSICTGAFALAQLGLIDGKQATTHWSACSELAVRYPRVQVSPDALYVQDGKVWTSAGVSTGIDMCLALVAADVGDAIANEIAKRLVLYAKRRGNQSQFSQVLSAQVQAASPFAELIEWMRDNLVQPLGVAQLADRVALSERSFQRKFTEAMRETPAHFVESLRLEKVRLLLIAKLPLKTIAATTGYTSTGQMSKAFERRIGMSPSLFRELHAG